MNEVFVDTSGVVALLFRRDAHHHQASAAWKKLVTRRATLITTELVIAESVTLARSRGGYDLLRAPR